MPEIQTLSVNAADGVNSTMHFLLPEGAVKAAVYWLPALGVGVRPNERFASALASQGIAMAIHEWRGLGTSDVRAGRRKNWSYYELLKLDIPAGSELARHRLRGVPWLIGGHSLGAQLALLYAAQQPQLFAGTWVVASGQPWWRTFSGMPALLLLGAAYGIGPLTAACGYFPGQRLGFAGREARGLMRDWAATVRNGRYKMLSIEQDLTPALKSYRGAVAAVRMQDDRFVPAASLEHLQNLTPQAAWQTHVLDKHDFGTQRADHFSWLRDPGPVATRLTAWTRHLLADR